MKIKNLTLLLLFAVILTYTSCDIGKNGFKQSETGLRYKFYLQNDTVKPEIGDFITAKMKYGLKDSIIFSSDIAGGTIEFPIGESKYPGDIFEGIRMMSVGDSATFIVNADSFYLVTAGAPQLPPFLKPGQKLYFHLKLIDFKTKKAYEQLKKEELEKLKEEEPDRLKEYLEANKIYAEPEESGLYFISKERGKGTKVEEGKMVKIHYIVRLLNGSKVYSTYDTDKPMEIELGKRFETDGFNEGLSKMRKGGKAEFIVPSDIGFGEKGRGQVIPPYSTLLYEVEVLDVRSKEEYRKEMKEERVREDAKREKEKEELKKKEPDLIEGYLEDNDIEVKPTESGLYYIETEEGSGDYPKEGDEVEVNYKLYFLDGELLQDSRQSGKPYSFEIGSDGVIKGWNEAIPLMKEGGKAKILLPSKLAYGEMGRGRRIPPYTPLLFEVELLDIK